MLIFQLIGVQVVVFFVIFLVIRHLMYKNTTSAVNRLKVADEENENKLKGLRVNISKAEETYQERLAEMEKDIQKQREEANQTIDAEKAITNEISSLEGLRRSHPSAKPAIPSGAMAPNIRSSRFLNRNEKRLKK